jgi:hypothetical protein
MLASMIQKLDTKMADFQAVIGEDVDSMFTQLQDLRAMVVTCPGDASLGIAEECATIWETFLILRSCILDPGPVHQFEQNLSAMESSITSMGRKVNHQYGARFHIMRFDSAWDLEVYAGCGTSGSTSSSAPHC